MLIDLIRYLTGKKVKVVFNNYSTTKPFSTLFGFDRGTSIARYYVEKFLSGRAGLMGGRVLEIGKSSYSRRFGGQRMAALELVSDKETREALPETAPLFRDLRCDGLRRGLLFRPMGKVVYLFLPQAATREALDDILDRFGETLRKVLR